MIKITLWSKTLKNYKKKINKNQQMLWRKKNYNYLVKKKKTIENTFYTV